MSSKWRLQNENRKTYIFWDLGEQYQYVYYTPHQTFMTYKVLFLIVLDGSKDIYDEVTDVLFPMTTWHPTYTSTS